MTITQLPPAPSRDDGDDFGPKCDATFAAMPVFIDELNAFALDIAGTYSATSSTSLVVGAGTKTLTITTGAAFKPGQTLVLARTAAPENQMVGTVSTHNSTTGALTVLATTFAGSGTFTDWTVSLAPSNLAQLSGNRVLLASITASAASTVDFDTNIDASFDEYVVAYVGATFSVATNLLLRFKQSGAWVTTSTYAYRCDFSASTTTASTILTTNGPSDSMLIATSIGIASDASISGELSIWKPASTALRKLVRAKGAMVSNSSSAIGVVESVGSNSGVAAVTGIRIYPQNGTFSGTFYLFGIKK